MQRVILPMLSQPVGGQQISYMKRTYYWKFWLIASEINFWRLFLSLSFWSRFDPVLIRQTGWLASKNVFLCTFAAAAGITPARKTMNYWIQGKGRNRAKSTHYFFFTSYPFTSHWKIYGSLKNEFSEIKIHEDIYVCVCSMRVACLQNRWLILLGLKPDYSDYNQPAQKFLGFPRFETKRIFIPSTFFLPISVTARPRHFMSRVLKSSAKKHETWNERHKNAEQKMFSRSFLKTCVQSIHLNFTHFIQIFNRRRRLKTCYFMKSLELGGLEASYNTNRKWFIKHEHILSGLLRSSPLRTIPDWPFHNFRSLLSGVLNYV